MLYVLKRLLPGLLVIALAMAVLLLSDLQHRKPPKTTSPYVALLKASSRPVLDDTIAGAIEGLGDHGFVDGKTIQLRQFNPEGDLPTADSMAKSIVGGNYTMVITASTPMLQTMASCNRAGKLTHVFAAVTDPFVLGVGIERDNPLHHPKHLVGVGTFQPVREVIRLAKQCNPKLNRLGVVWCRSEAASEACVLLARDECAKLGMTLLEANTDNSAGVLEAAESIVARNVDAIWIGGDNVVELAPTSIVKAASAGGIPVIVNSPQHCESGALLGLGADYLEVGRIAGDLAGRILKGLDPATVKIENAVPQHLALNYSALKGLRDQWTFPQDLQTSAAMIIDGNGKKKMMRPARPEHPKPVTINRSLKKWRIQFLNYAESTFVEDCHRGFFDELVKLGMVQGRDYEMKVTNAQGDMSALIGLVDAAITAQADLILLTSTPTLQATVKKVTDVTIVFNIVANPMLAGVGKSYEDHLPNVTGISTKSDFDGMAALVKECLPNAKRVGTLFSPSEDNCVYNKDEMAAALQKQGIELVAVAASASSEVPDAALSLTSRNIDAVCQVVGNILDTAFAGVSQAAHKDRKPLFAFTTSQAVKGGAAIAIARDYEQAGRDMALMTARVMGGESPARIPIQVVSKTNLIVNPTAADQCGFTVPSSVINRADLVVGKTPAK